MSEKKEERKEETGFSLSSTQPTKSQVESVFYSLLPINKSISDEDKSNGDTNWFAWGGLGLFLIGAGGFMGYQAQTKDASASSFLLDTVVSKEKQNMANKKVSAASVPGSSSLNAKPHPFIKQSGAAAASSAKKTVEGPVSVSHVAVRALGIATLYAVSAFSVSLFGLALACGVHSQEDAIEKLNQLKQWGPQARKRVLKALDITESKKQIDSEEELAQVSHLTTEEQFEQIFTKHAAAADAEVAAAGGLLSSQSVKK